ncbi:MAG: phosphotransferase [Verrucomicrobiia bacterium]
MHTALIERTRNRLSHWLSPQSVVEVIDRAGSDRCFYRIGENGNRRLIVMRYGLARGENARFTTASGFLSSIGVRTPEIYAWDPEERLIWMADLGTQSLWSAREMPWEKRRLWYRDALRQAALLHRTTGSEATAYGLPVEREFDAALYQWEQGYFFEQCLGRHFGVPDDVRARLQALDALHSIPHQLVAQEKRMIHRDLQSQNILLAGDEVVFIDFQGMRPGHPLYDVASLLLDPYVELSRAEREELFDHYASQAGPGISLSQESFRLCGLQRLMQALGAFAYLGHTVGKTEFLDHIPRAIARLTEIAGQLPGLHPLAELLQEVAG